MKQDREGNIVVLVVAIDVHPDGLLASNQLVHGIIDPQVGRARQRDERAIRGCLLLIVVHALLRPTIGLPLLVESTVIVRQVMDRHGSVGVVRGVAGFKAVDRILQDGLIGQSRHDLRRLVTDHCPGQVADPIAVEAQAMYPLRQVGPGRLKEQYLALPHRFGCLRQQRLIERRGQDDQHPPLFHRGIQL